MSTIQPTGRYLSRVPLGTRETVADAVVAARAAFPAWSATPIKERVQVFYRYKAPLAHARARVLGID